MRGLRPGACALLALAALFVPVLSGCAGSEGGQPSEAGGGVSPALEEAGGSEASASELKEALDRDTTREERRELKQELEEEEPSESEGESSEEPEEQESEGRSEPEEAIRGESS